MLVIMTTSSMWITIITAAIYSTHVNVQISSSVCEINHGKYFMEGIIPFIKDLLETMKAFLKFICHDAFRFDRVKWVKKRLI